MPSRDLTAAAELPAVRPLYFIPTFTRAGQLLVWALWGVLALLVLALLLAEAFPAALVLTYTPVVNWSAQTVELVQAQFDGVVAGALARAYSGYVTLAAGPIEVSIPLTVAWAVLQAMGWAALLAASSRIEGLSGYGIYLVAAIALVQAGFGSVVMPGDAYRLIAGGATLVLVLGPAFAFRMRWWVVSLPVQFLIFLAVYGALYGVALGLGGEVALHRVTVQALPVLAALAVFTLLFTAREPLNLIFLLTTNGRTPERRQPLWVVLTLALLLLSAAGLALANELLSLGLDLFVRPVHLLALAALVAPVTSQNVYHQLRGFIPAQLAFVLFGLGCSLLTVSTAAFGYATAEVLITGMIERMATLVYLTVGALYLVYVLLHFTSYLRRRVNVYYVLLEPPRPTNVRFLVVWFMAVMLLLFLEGQERWRSVRMIWGSYTNLMADNALLAGDVPRALRLYRFTVRDGFQIGRPSGDAKANYQLASLGYAYGRSLADAERYYRQAEVFRPFPAARLNHANLLMALGQRPQAVRVLQTPPEVPGAPLDPRLLSNLAGLHLAMAQPDSAILTLRRAIDAAPDQALLFANLAQVYRAHRRDDVAGPLLRLAATMAPNDPHVVVNAAAYELAHAVPARWPELRVSQARRADWPLQARLNLAVLAARRAARAPTKDRVELARDANAIADALVEDDNVEIGEALLVKLHATLAADSLEVARSRADFLAERIAEQRAPALHALGVYYLSRGCAPMAEYYLGRAATSGIAADSLPQAQLMARLGRHTEAATQLDLYRALHPEAWALVTREVSLIERAYGQGEQAALTYPSGRYSPFDRLLQARYAHAAGQMVMVNDGLIGAAELDTTSVEPYILAGELYRGVNDTTALENLEAGRTRRASAAALARLEVAIAGQLVHMGRTGPARQLLDSLDRALQKGPLRESTAADSLARALQLCRAEWLAATGQDSACIVLLDAYLLQQPLDERAQLLWAERTARRNVSDALNGLLAAIELNDRSPRLWAAAAQLNARVSRAAEAREAAQRAIDLSFPEARRAAVRRALEPLLQADEL